ncbi:MAG: GWxTD domain-containing protein, partial [Bacteroidales bacterium]
MDRINSYRNYAFMVAAALACAVMVSCKSTQKSTTDLKDLSYLYNPTKSSLKTRYSVLNETDESSVLSVKFFSTDMFFSEANPKGIPMSLMLVTVKLYNITGGKILADTARVDLSIVREKDKPEYTYRIPLKVEPGISYVAEVKILDKLRLQVTQSFVPFNTGTTTNRYNFYARGQFQKNVLFNPVVRVNEYVNLVYPRKRIDSLFISFYKPLKEIPYPPSLLVPEKTIDYEPDTVIALAYSDTLPLMFPKTGVYFCSAGRDLADGFTFFNFGESFPSMTRPEVMIEPLAYLTSADEMEALRTSVRPKLALDDFWIKCGGNVDKARELIRIYYTRILYANYYFTSYKEGWRTERGMIYTIYGPPDKVYKT